jgi:hypothetical protein
MNKKSPPSQSIDSSTNDATPLASDLWAGIAGHFDSITQVLCEFIDNSVSNFEAHRGQLRSIRLDVEELRGGEVRVRIEDTGTGIQNLTPSMRLGDQTVRETPLNEHGFGFKHALASADPENKNWVIHTRTKVDFQNGQYRRLSAPYDFHLSPETIDASKEPWPGSFNGSGTIIEFICSSSFFNTVQKGIKGQAGFTRCLDYLTEELGYIYSGLIEKGKATISVTSTKATHNKTVESVKPSWNGFYAPSSGTEKIDLGGGELLIDYQFGEMKESKYFKHYKRNQSTSGVEIRINGRLMMSNIFKEIWHLENHPSYNHFLVTINLNSQNRQCLPKTRTSKNGIRSGDPKLEKLFEWIRNTHPNPPKDLANAQSERDLVKDLRDLKDKHIRSKTKHLEMDFKVFNSLNSPVSADLYVFDGKDVVLYEAKKDTADMQNVYQLLMYWDGMIEDGKTPTEGILIASDFSPGVEVILKVLNSSKDRKGNSYNFSTRTWNDEGIPYPS